MGKILSILKVLPLVVVLLSMVPGCNSSGCTDNKSSIPLAGFYSYETLSAVSLSNISVGGVDAPNDSLLLDHTSASQVYLPFRSLHDETVFFIRYEDTGESDEPDDPGEEGGSGEDSGEGGDSDSDSGDSQSLLRRVVMSRAIPAIEDTLTFRYERIPYFASEDCGAMYRYRVTEFEATRHLIDSIALVDSVITNVDRQTIQIYFRTQQPDNPEEEQ